MKLVLQKTQRKFCDSTAFETLFGGAAGGGKSYVQLAEAMMDSMKYPGYRTLILRRTFPDLERSLIDLHRKIFPPKPFYRYNESRHRGTFANGSIVDFGYLDRDSDVYQYQGAEYDCVRFDELTQFTEWQYTYLLSRVRGVTPYPRRVKSTANPGGIGHVWVKKRFIEPAAPGEPFTVEAEMDTPAGKVKSRIQRVFIPSKLTDNRKLMESDPQYLTNMMHLPKKLRDAYLNGRWDVLEGQFFSEWDAAIHVCKPFDIPPEWKRYFGMDYGMDMLAGYWVAVDFEGDLWVYRELYEGRDNGMGNGGAGHIISEAARRIREVGAGERPVEYMGPGDLDSRSRDSGKSQAEIFWDCGVPLATYRQNRRDGWMAVREYLAPKLHADGGNRPRLHIFDTCRNLIRTLPELQIDPADTDDILDADHELTHAPDALRLICSRFYSPSREARREVDTLRENFYTKRRPQGAAALGEGTRMEAF